MATNRWWSPTTDVMTATRLIDRMFDQFFGYGNPRAEQAEGGTPTYALPVDVLALTVKAAPFERQGRLLRQERPWGNWLRKLELPKEVQPDRISADVEDGVLTVTVPKAATAQPVRIPVGATGQRKQLEP